MTGARRGMDDTSPEARGVMDAIYTRMSGVEKWRRLGELTVAANEIALAGLRMRNPGDPESTIRLRLAELRLGRKLVREAYGRTADEP